MSKLLKQIQVATETGSDDLKDFAKVAGMTTKEFKQAFEKDSIKALTAFISGLNDTERNGKSAIAILDKMGLTEVRLSNTILSLANSSDLMTKAVNLSNEAWEDNTALSNEAEKRYETLKSKIIITLNKIKDIAVTIGNKLMPSIEKLLVKVGEWTKKFENLNEEQIDTILNIGLIVSALGPALTILGKITSGIGGAIKAFGTFKTALEVMKGTTTSTSSSITILSSVIKGVCNPLGIVVTTIAALSAGLWLLGQRSDETVNKAEEQISALEKQKKKTDELKKAQEEYLSSNLSEIENIEDLKNELLTLVDTNGKIKEGYEGRVKFILGELNSALGTEYSATNNVIDKYKELTDSIDEVITKKKASIILNSMEESYSNALKSRSEAIKNLAELEKTYASDKQKIIEKQNEMIETQKKKQDIFTLSRINQLKQEIDMLQDNVNAYEEQKSKIIEYNVTIDEYETASATIKEGNVNKIEELNDKFTNSYKQRKDETIASLAEQIQYESINLETQEAAYKKTQGEITKNNKNQAQERLNNLTEELVSATTTVGNLSTEQINAWTNLAKGSYDTYKEYIQKVSPEMQQKIQECTGIVIKETPFAETAMLKMSLSMLNKMLEGLTDSEKRELLKQAGIGDVEKVIQGLEEGNLAEEEGKDILSKLYKGLNNSNFQNNLWAKARAIASKLSSMLTVRANVTGGNIAFSAALPGHKDGLDYVPYDNYVARLHEGERVLTAEENDSLIKSQKRSKSNNLKFESQETNNEKIDYTKMANAFLNALNSCKLKFEEDGIVRIVKDELYKVV